VFSNLFLISGVTQKSRLLKRAALNILL